MRKLRQSGTQAKRKQTSPQPSLFRWRGSYAWVLLIAPLLAIGFNLAEPLRLMPIGRVQLVGSFENLTRQDVEATVRPYIGEGFLSLDINQLRQSLLVKPWVDSVSVRRVWPDRIRISIKEKRAVARWGKRHLLSDSAKVYRAETASFGHLPLVHADGHRPDWALQQFIRLKARFNSVDEELVALQVDRRGALNIELINGLQIKLGRNDIDYKVERLVNIYSKQILPRREQIERLDLRYSNGFAVAWKKAILQGRDKASIWSNSNV